MLRWSAVFAGATVAVALWVLLQMIGMGAGMAAIDLDDAGSLKSVGIGTTVWTLFAPLVALFVGGFVAARLAATNDQKVGATHGFITWAIASLLGMLATVSLVSMLTAGGTRVPTRGLMLSDDVRVHPSLRAVEVQKATDRAGKMLLGSGISLLLGLGAAVGGGLLATRDFGRTRRRRTTAEVPVVPPPPHVDPNDVPHVTTP